MVGESLSGNNSARKLDLRKIVLLCALAAFGSVAWDLMIDPMFTAYGYWVWGTQLFPRPEISGIPLTNFLGWFIVVFLMLFTIVHLTFVRARSESSTVEDSLLALTKVRWTIVKSIKKTTMNQPKKFVSGMPEISGRGKSWVPQTQYP